MGLGKSAQAITACDDVLAERVLVVCPAVARINWEREFRKFSPVRRDFEVVLEGLPKAQGAMVISYDLAIRAHAKGVFQGKRFDALILDEQHFLKNPLAKRSKAIFGKHGLVHQAKYVWCLTGTPMPNGDPRELWILLYTAGRTKLSYFDFGVRYCQWAVGAGPTSPMPQCVGVNREHRDELRALLKPIMLRRRKEDVLTQLPPITFGDIIVERAPVDLRQNASFYKYAVDPSGEENLMKELATMQRRLETETTAIGGLDSSRSLHIFKLLEVMAPSVSTLRRYVGLQKVPAVAEMVKHELELGAYDKVVIFAIHRDVIEGLRALLAPYGAVTLYGNTAPELRQRNIDRFQRKDLKYRVFIGNIQAAGTSVTLTRASNIVIAESSWTPAENAQAIMRVHRIGQLHNVLCRFVGLADSIDEKISYVIKRKTRDIIAIVDGDARYQNERVDFS